MTVAWQSPPRRSGWMWRPRLRHTTTDGQPSSKTRSIRCEAQRSGRCAAPGGPADRPPSALRTITGNAVTSVTPSPGSTPNRLTANRGGCRQRERDTGREAEADIVHGVTHDGAGHTPTRCAQRDANRDLFLPLRRAKAHDAIDAARGEQECQRGKQRHDSRQETARTHRAPDVLVQRHGCAERLVRIDVPDRGANGRHQGRRIGRSHDQVIRLEERRRLTHRDVDFAPRSPSRRRCLTSATTAMTSLTLPSTLNRAPSGSPPSERIRRANVSLMAITNAPGRTSRESKSRPVDHPDAHRPK